MSENPKYILIKCINGTIMSNALAQRLLKITGFSCGIPTVSNSGLGWNFRNLSVPSLSSRVYYSHGPFDIHIPAELEPDIKIIEVSMTPMQYLDSLVKQELKGQQFINGTCKDCKAVVKFPIPEGKTIEEFKELVAQDRIGLHSDCHNQMHLQSSYEQLYDFGDYEIVTTAEA